MMLQRDGHFFHIDFGHFLGHFKKALGLPKENRSFYYSDALEAVLVNQKRLGEFERLCAKTGIPELQELEDVRYVEEKLMLGLSPEKAGHKFKKMLKKAKASVPQMISGIVHTWVH
jgi:phosphatidylinositol-4,5-bisphosphate 3-kinase